MKEAIETERAYLLDMLKTGGGLEYLDLEGQMFRMRAHLMAALGHLAEAEALLKAGEAERAVDFFMKAKDLL